VFCGVVGDGWEWVSTNDISKHKWEERQGALRRSQRTMMKPASFLIALAAVFGVFLTSVELLAEGVGYRSELFQSTKLIYEDSFDGELNPAFWEVRQSTTWVVKEGVLSGGPSSKEFQAKKLASDDPTHAGLKPVIFLKQVPENFVCVMRVRYDGEAYAKGFPLLDIGHHIHSLIFGETTTTLKIKKNEEVLTVEQPLLKLNEWHEVAIEFKKGTLLLSIDGKKHRFESERIDMAGHAQIDFKGLDFGGCQVDHVRLWEGF